jgi:L-ascorbate metabolism protein UlaG (beta-lactamase superfamily)
MKLTWLGQGGFLLESNGRRLLIDPYLSDSLAKSHGTFRLIPPPMTIDQTMPDVVFITHDHLDHFDPETMVPLFNTFADCQLVGPQSVVEHGRREGFAEERMSCIAPGQSVEAAGYRLTATPAHHSDRFAVGLLIDVEGHLLYVSGDTLHTPTLAADVLALAPRAIDCVLICINGKLNNMDAACAAQVVAELRPSLAIPMHYGMFAKNTVDPEEFLSLCRSAGRATRTLTPGVPVVFSIPNCNEG